MKLLSTLALTTVLAAGTAFAAETHAAHATHSAKAKPAGSADTHCRDEAKQRKLTGIDRKSFIQKCRAESMKKS